MQPRRRPISRKTGIKLRRRSRSRTMNSRRYRKDIIGDTWDIESNIGNHLTSPSNQENCSSTTRSCAQEIEGLDELIKIMLKDIKSIPILENNISMAKFSLKFKIVKASLSIKGAERFCI